MLLVLVRDANVFPGSGKNGIGPGGSMMWGCAIYKYELLDVNHLNPKATDCVR